MTHVITVCEGQSEEAFVREIIYPALIGLEIYVQPRLIPTSPHAKGGALDGPRVLRFLRNTLRERQNAYVTTFFDLYGLPSGFPGRTEAGLPTDPIDRAVEIETGFGAAVVEQTGCRPDRFIPHIQPYEFESLLFSDASSFAKTEDGWRTFAGQLEEARKSAPSPEHINDGTATHPSARLNRLIPPYNKVRHGVTLGAEIGIERIRAECRHFDQWMKRLEDLPPLQT